nr:unnamed protein product [Pongo abelii]
MARLSPGTSTAETALGKTTRKECSSLEILVVNSLISFKSAQMLLLKQSKKIEANEQRWDLVPIMKNVMTTCISFWNREKTACSNISKKYLWQTQWMVKFGSETSLLICQRKDREDPAYVINSMILVEIIDTMIKIRTLLFAKSD